MYIEVKPEKAKASCKGKVLTYGEDPSNDLYFKDMPLCFVTTRSTGYLEKVFKDVEVEFPMVVMNGSAVYDFKNKNYDVVKNINN